MADKPHKAKKSKKNRKHDRNRKNALRQSARTERNKVRRLNYERAKAGLKPVSPVEARYLMDNCKIR